MAHLVGNGTHLYRRNGHLVRTPIVKTIALSPDEMAYYDVAGSYRNDVPTGGFVADSEHYTQVAAIGKLMRRNYANLVGTVHPGPQIWRSVTSSHLPEFIFYQGAWSTSRGNAHPEAFIKVPAYHFTIPQTYNGWDVSAATLSLIHGGTILQYMMTRTANQYFATTAPTSLLPSNSGWRGAGWSMDFGLYSSLASDPTDMHGSAIDTILLDTNRAAGNLNQGAANARVIWSNAAITYTDGCIPVTSSPWTQAAALSSNFCAALASGMGGWIVGTPSVGVTNGNTDLVGYDYPFYDPGQGNPGYWLCCSFWGFSLSLTLTIG